MTQRADTVRWTSHCTDIMGIDYSIPQERIDRTKAAHDNLMNHKAELDVSSVWTGMRPLSPDDVPILAEVPGFSQVLINTGHGSKGASTFITSAVYLTQLLLKEKNKIFNDVDYNVNRFWLI